MKIKLITIFLLATSAVALVGYISYEGLSKLVTTLESTIKPDYRKEHFNQLIYSLSQAENGVRIYTITRESRYLEPFYSSINDVDRQMEILDKYARGDKMLALHLDTLHTLIEQKIELQKKLIELKEDHTQIDVYQHVLEKIQSIEKKNEELDSLEIEFQKINKEEETLKTEGEEVQKEEKRGFFRRLFTSNKKLEQAEKEAEALAVSADSLAKKADTLSQVIDTLRKEKMSTEIQSSLVEIKSKEQEINKNLTEAELLLTKKDQDISDLIKLEVEKIEQYFDSEKIKTAKQASTLFDDTTQLIKVVGTVSAMLFLVLIFIILNDVQINQRFRKRLENAKKRAEDLAAAKEDFLSNMSHEIRTPLNAIIGFTEQLNVSSPGPAERKKYLTIIKNSSQHLLSLINDILDYNKLEAGKIKIERVPFSVDENARSVYDTLLINAQNKGLDFQLVIDDSLSDKKLVGDPVRFRQILFNLAGNAIKFTDRGLVSIEITYDDTEKLRPCLKMVVADTGIGMTEKEVGIIFNKFDQADQSISKKYGGTGLGLTIVKKLVDLQKGKILVSSQSGQGSSFTVKLPYAAAHEEEKSPANGNIHSHTSLAQQTVLIVDDEEYNVLLFETILKKYKLRTFSATSGTGALEHLGREKIDLVLLDLQMKEMDGFQTLTKVREMNNEIPVIAITASASQAIHKKCIQSGFEDVVLKPVNEKEFIGQIANHFKIGTIILKTKEGNGKKMPESLKQVFDLVQNDEALAMNMISIYLKNIQKTQKILQEGLDQKDSKALQEAAHRAIPSTRHMGFEDLVIRLKHIESLASTSEVEKNREYLLETCHDIDDVIQWLINFLEKHTKQNPVVS